MVATFDRSIPPGGAGKIILKVDTRGYQEHIVKRARVYSDDPHEKVQAISIKAFVKSPIYYMPRFVYLKGCGGDTVTKTVTIKAGEKKALKVEPIYFDLAEKVVYRIEEVKTGKIYKIYFTNIPGSVGSYQGVLKLKTNYFETPEIAIRLKGRFTEASQVKNPR